MQYGNADDPLVIGDETTFEDVRKYFLEHDESNLYPVSNRFNVSEVALQECEEFQYDGVEAYAAAVEHRIGAIVNSDELLEKYSRKADFFHEVQAVRKGLDDRKADREVPEVYILKQDRFSDEHPRFLEKGHPLLQFFPTSDLYRQATVGDIVADKIATINIEGPENTLPAFYGKNQAHFVGRQNIPLSPSATKDVGAIMEKEFAKHPDFYGDRTIHETMWGLTKAVHSMLVGSPGSDDPDWTADKACLPVVDVHGNFVPDADERIFEKGTKGGILDRIVYGFEDVANDTHVVFYQHDKGKQCFDANPLNEKDVLVCDDITSSYAVSMATGKPVVMALGSVPATMQALCETYPDKHFHVFSPLYSQDPSLESLPVTFHNQSFTRAEQRTTARKAFDFLKCRGLDAFRKELARELGPDLAKECPGLAQASGKDKGLERQ